MRSILISIFTFAVFVLIITHGFKKVDKSPIIARTNLNPYINYGSIKDRDGNVYKTVTIGIQVLMAELLRTTNLNYGTAISLIIFQSSVIKLN